MLLIIFVSLFLFNLDFFLNFTDDSYIKGFIVDYVIQLLLIFLLDWEVPYTIEGYLLSLFPYFLPDPNLLVLTFSMLSGMVSLRNLLFHFFSSIKSIGTLSS